MGGWGGSKPTTPKGGTPAGGTPLGGSTPVMGSPQHRPQAAGAWQGHMPGKHNQSPTVCVCVCVCVCVECAGELMSSVIICPCWYRNNRRPGWRLAATAATATATATAAAAEAATSETLIHTSAANTVPVLNRQAPPRPPPPPGSVSIAVQLRPSQLWCR